MAMEDAKVADWFANADPHDGALAALRALLRGAGLDEVFKWRSPCYCRDGGNIATIWSFKDRAAIGFFKGTLLPDPQGLLQAPGENSRAMRVLNFTDAAQVAASAPAIRGFIEAAIAVEARGEAVDFSTGQEIEVPAELTDALDRDPALAAAWAALTPGRRRGWLLQIAAAKQPATRAARITKAAPRILAGKGPNDR
jgi:uncharacterized protein YdeI (YjbR/CyaY-like superfamily)